MTRSIDIEALCAEKGLRITEQRKVIARVLGESEDHPDVEALHARAVGDRSRHLDRHRLPHRPPVRGSGHPRAPRFRRRPRPLRGGGRDPSRPSDRRRDRQCHRVRRRGARGAAAPDRREARLPPGRSPHGALRRRPRPRDIRPGPDAPDPARRGDRRRLARLRSAPLSVEAVRRALALAAASSSAMSAGAAGMRVRDRGHAAHRTTSCSPPIMSAGSTSSRSAAPTRAAFVATRRCRATGPWSAGSPASTTRSTSPATRGARSTARPTSSAARSATGRAVALFPGRHDRRRPRAAALPRQPVRLALPAACPA